MSTGECDNLLLATYLSAKCPVFVAPAMDLDMYKHPGVTTALAKLQSYKNIVIPATSGELASGLTGEGRMAEPEDIVAFVEQYVLSGLPLRGKKVLITAGPTYEAIDPVRFIGNHSSGKMGFEIAKCAANFGAEVVLISGPSAQQINLNLVQRIDVVSAQQMFDEVHKYFKTVDIAILSAAVADYKPKYVSDIKIKKQAATLSIELESTKDILKSLGDIKTQQFLVGFALETNDEITNAIKKLKSKNLNLIVLNSLNHEGAGFGVSTNKVTFITDKNDIIENDLKSKAEVAEDLLQLIIKQVHA